jgi:hypothetical protein
MVLISVVMGRSFPVGRQTNPFTPINSKDLAGLRYEIAISIFGSDVVWLGDWPDVEVFRWIDPCTGRVQAR